MLWRGDCSLSGGIRPAVCPIGGPSSLRRTARTEIAQNTDAGALWRAGVERLGGRVGRYEIRMLTLRMPIFSTSA